MDKEIQDKWDKVYKECCPGTQESLDLSFKSTWSEEYLMSILLNSVEVYNNIQSLNSLQENYKTGRTELENSIFGFNPQVDIAHIYLWALKLNKAGIYKAVVYFGFLGRVSMDTYIPFREDNHKQRREFVKNLKKTKLKLENKISSLDLSKPIKNELLGILKNPVFVDGVITMMQISDEQELKLDCTSPGPDWDLSLEYLSRKKEQ